jgi:uncharacterized protein YjaG (DUF416 family)
MKTMMDACLDELQDALSGLQRRSLATFFAACAERLLPLYQYFWNKEQWGNPQLMREVLDDVWRHLEGEDMPDVKRRLEEVGLLVPHGDDFDAPDSTFAQDAAICVDAALRAISIDENVDVRWVEYSIEPARIAACMEETGFMELGSTEARAWEARALNNAKLRSDVDLCRDMIRSLKQAEPLDPAYVKALRKQMCEVRWSHEKLLGADPTLP